MINIDGETKIHQVDRVVTEVRYHKLTDTELLAKYAVPTEFFVSGDTDTGLPQLVGIDAPLTFRSLVDTYMADVKKERAQGLDYYTENMDHAMKYAARIGDSMIAFQLMDMIKAKDKNVFVSPEILIEVWEACRNHAYRLTQDGETERAASVLHRGIDLWQNQLNKLPLTSRLARLVNEVASSQIF